MLYRRPVRGIFLPISPQGIEINVGFPLKSPAKAPNLTTRNWNGNLPGSVVDFQDSQSHHKELK